MAYEFNLITETWIPVIRVNGKREEVGLASLLTDAHEIREIRTDQPITTAALFRLLLAILHRVFGPANMDAWVKIWNRGKLDDGPIKAYFEQWAERFDLFHPDHPFFQRADMEARDESISSLVQGISTGNDATLFNHNTAESRFQMGAAEAARALVTTQAFGLAGTKGPYGSFTDAACTRQVNFFLEGDNLFETLLLNLPSYPLPEAILPGSEKDMPAWEMDDANASITERPFGYLDYLTWHNRRVKLNPDMVDGHIVVQTMKYDIGLRLPAELRNPSAQYKVNNKQGLYPVRFDEAKSLWRDSMAILQAPPPGDQSLRPYCIPWLNDLVFEGILPEANTKRLLAIGMSTEPGKDKVYFQRQERFPLPLEYLHDQRLTQTLLKNIQFAEEIGKRFFLALEMLIGIYLFPEKKPSEKDKKIHYSGEEKNQINNLITHLNSERRFWSNLDAVFPDLLTALPFQCHEAETRWRHNAIEAARKSLTEAGNQMVDQARAWRAQVNAEHYLNFLIMRMTYKPKQEEEA